MYLLQKISIHKSARSVRQEVVSYLSENPEKFEKQPLEYFAGLPWPQYLNSMAQAGTYGDYITLQVASNFFNIELQIGSSLGNDTRTLKQPQEFESIAIFYLSYFAEDCS